MVLGTASTETVSTLTDSLIAGDGPKGLSIIHEALGTGTDARQFSRQLVSYLRHLLLIATAGHELPIDLTVDQQATMNRQARAVNRAFLIEAAKGFNTAAHIPTGSWQPQLPLELAFIELLPPTADPVSSDNPIDRPIKQQIEPDPVESSDPERAPEEAVNKPEESVGEPEENVGEPEESGSLVDSTTVASLESIKSHWPDLRERVAKRDTNLPALLASSKPLATEGSILILGFDYPILKEKFERKKEAKEIVAAELSELLRSPISVRTVVTEHYVPPATEESIDMDDFSALAQELGGVVHNQ
jgi:DNA polymerase-3 subunit gamma/tau